MQNETSEKLISWDLIHIYCAVGLGLCIMLLSVVWAEGGIMTDPFSYQRFVVILVAAIYGFGLGWLLYPRRFFLPREEE